MHRIGRHAPAFSAEKFDEVVPGEEERREFSPLLETIGCYRQKRYVSCSSSSN